MSIDEMLAQHFPASSETFRDLRVKDSEFDSICNDFLEMTNRVALKIARENNRRLQHLADIAETISSLAEEINGRLKQNEKSTSTDPQGHELR